MESNLTLLVVHIFVKWGVGEFKPTTFAFRPPGHRETEASESGDALELSFFFSVGPIDWFKKVSEEWSRKPCFSQWLCFYLSTFSKYL